MKTDTAMTTDLTTDQILEWLKNHPEFLSQHPEAMNFLSPPNTYNEDGTVVDFQKLMVKKLQKDHADAIEIQNLLVEHSRDNLNNQNKINAAVIHLLDASSFEEFIHIVTADLALTLDVDVVSLAIETENDDQNAPLNSPFSGVFLLEKGAVNQYMGDRAAVLQSNVTEAPNIFAEAAPLVQSHALLKLNIHPKAPMGILAFGSRKPEFFAPDQGIDSVSFLARVIERCIRAWLELPS